MDLLPKPTSYELSKWHKADYIKRIFTDHRHKSSLPGLEFGNWTIANYNSILLNNKELTYNQYLKTK
jgi:hypothetical protein